MRIRSDSDKQSAYACIHICYDMACVEKDINIYGSLGCAENKCFSPLCINKIWVTRTQFDMFCITAAATTAAAQLHLRKINKCSLRVMRRKHTHTHKKPTPHDVQYIFFTYLFTLFWYFFLFIYFMNSQHCWWKLNIHYIGRMSII